MIRKSLVAPIVLSAASAASAAITPSWRINTITPEHIAASGGALSSNSISVSLMVELTGGSLFNVAGLDIDGALQANFGLPGGTIRYFHRSGGGATNVDLPDPDDVASSPAQILNIDTRVSTAVRFEPASTPGRLNGTGTAQIGNVGLTPTTGSNRTGQFFNVAWGATPNNGGPGIFEIATITIVTGGLPGSVVNFDLPGNPTAFGLVADSLSPNTNIPLPPMPFGVIPEPASFAIAGLGLLALRRK